MAAKGLDKAFLFFLMNIMSYMDKLKKSSLARHHLANEIACGQKRRCKSVVDHLELFGEVWKLET